MESSRSLFEVIYKAILLRYIFHRNNSLVLLYNDSCSLYKLLKRLQSVVPELLLLIVLLTCSDSVPDFFIITNNNLPIDKQYQIGGYTIALFFLFALHKMSTFL